MVMAGVGLARMAPTVWAAIVKFPAGRTLIQRALSRAVRTAQGMRISWANMGPLQRVMTAVGVAEGVDILLPWDLPGLSDLIPGGGGIQIGPASPAGGGAPGAHPGTVTKTWTANGVPFVRLDDGRLGAYSSRRGSWKYWRPKKPIILYAGGSSDLRTLLKADRAAERQLRRLKKAVDRRFPTRRRSRASAGRNVVIESGPGHVIT